jgi:hypothetical protein
MPEPVIKPDEKKEEKPLGQEVREKSFQQLLREQRDATQKPETPATPDPETPAPDAVSDEQKAKEAEAKAAADKQEEENRQADLAKKAAEEVIKKQEEEKQKKQDRIKAEEAAKAKEEELKPKFTATDKDGNPVPKNYDEIAAESARIAEEKALARLRAEQQEKEAEAARVAAEKTKNEETIKAQQKAAEEQLQKELDTDLNDLYAGNKLPKIKDPKDPNDPGNKEFKNLFETAQKVNAERMAKGEPPIRSIKLIYYEHYKPLAKPAGHDAPVLGSETTISNEPPVDKYVVARDRNKSMAQLVKEEAMRAAKKLQIRGK